MNTLEIKANAAVHQFQNWVRSLEGEIEQIKKEEQAKKLAKRKES